MSIIQYDPAKGESVYMASVARKKPMTPKPVTMWAVVVKSKRSEWIHWPTINETKRRTILGYMKYQFGYSESPIQEFQVQVKINQCRLARVVVAEEGGK